ncbi:MAG: hypothetical protein WCQ20_01855 [Synechococcaceae cyanobacterium ELA739]
MLLGPWALFGCTAANALILNWSVSNQNGVVGSGRIFASDTPTSAPDIYTATNITGTWTGGIITGLNGAGTFDSGLGDNTFKYNSSSSEFLLSGSGLNFAVSGLTFNAVNMYGAVLGYSGAVRADYNGLTNPSDGSASSSFVNLTSSSARDVSVPAPIPILGLPAAFLSTRKLRKRIKASKETSNIS